MLIRMVMLTGDKNDSSAAEGHLFAGAFFCPWPASCIMR